MTPADKDKIMKILEAFCNENLGQNVTRWNAPTLLNTVGKEMDSIMDRDNAIRPNTAQNNSQ
jgi:hypothetical protein